ncbi:MAG: Wzy polymerase domain-containing protein [Gallionella sp.]|nr:Wzy polymerase domain-containing protein [Gallionella sp.]
MSLALVGLMWVFPFLHFRHRYPLTTFDQEWWSALLGVLALTLLLARDGRGQAGIPRIVQLPVALIAVVLLQMAMGMTAYVGQGLLYILYLLFAALLMMLGARLRDCLGVDKVAMVLAICLLAGAELSALIGVLQHYRWHTLLDQMVVVKVSTGVYGNLAQPNHFANYIALGLISLGLLFQQRKLHAAYVVLLAAPLLLVMTLSGSRSGWLYLLMMAALAAWAGRGRPELRTLFRYALLLLAGFAAMHGLVQLPFMQGAGNNYNIMQRMFGDAASGGIRLYLWHEAWLMFKQSPWLGAGFGQFAWQHFQLGPLLQRTHLTGLYNNAHNLIFQLAAEAGIVGLLALFAALGVWLNGLRRVSLTATHWWGHAVLGVLAIHSLLEYPLWYAYFVAVAAVLLGALDETRYRLAWCGAARASLAVMLLLGLFSLLQLRSGYQQLKDTLAIRPASATAAAEVQQIRSGLLAVRRGLLLSPYGELFMSSYHEVNKDRLKQKLVMNERVMRFMPVASVVYRQALLLAQNGQQAQAQRVWERAVWSYPGDAEKREQLVKLAEKDPEHFSALLEFALQKEQEYLRAVHN